MTDRALLQQALGALEWNLPVIEDYGDHEQLNRQHRAITALRERLAQPEQQVQTATYTCGVCGVSMQMEQPEPEPLQFKCTVIDDAHPNGVPLEQWGKQPEQEPVTLPCCGYADASAVKWNQYSKTVQCHNCGQTYTPLAQPEQDVPATCFGNMVPVGWLEPPDGVFRANPLYKIKFPSKLLSWQVPLYTALPQPEPVAKVELMLTGGAAGLATRIVEIDDHLRERLRPGQLLYTGPPQRKPLTDEAIAQIAAQGHQRWLEFARAIEAAHGIKGGA